MQLTPEEIDTIEEAGVMNGGPVRMIRTKGGFWIAIGRPKGKFKDEAIAAGSHPAIVKYNVEKQYPDFQPAMMKSEHFSDGAHVDGHSHFLSEDLRKSGHDVYSVQFGTHIDFHVTKHGMNVASIRGDLKENSLVFENVNLKIPQEMVRALSGATIERAAALNLERVGFKRTEK